MKFGSAELDSAQNIFSGICSLLSWSRLYYQQAGLTMSKRMRTFAIYIVGKIVDYEIHSAFHVGDSRETIFKNLATLERFELEGKALHKSFKDRGSKENFSNAQPGGQIWLGYPEAPNSELLLVFAVVDSLEKIADYILEKLTQVENAAIEKHYQREFR